MYSPWKPTAEEIKKGEGRILPTKRSNKPAKIYKNNKKNTTKQTETKKGATTAKRLLWLVVQLNRALKMVGNNYIKRGWIPTFRLQERQRKDLPPKEKVDALESDFLSKGRNIGQLFHWNLKCKMVVTILLALLYSSVAGSSSPEHQTAQKPQRRKNPRGREAKEKMGGYQSEARTDDQGNKRREKRKGGEEESLYRRAGWREWSW